ncbi:unnamed protein product [Arctia plantaginis]|uniref:Uncharacterized protein n=1 Tax=Arctia plantaginis TaxID=874455 RepID=A0A8S0ZHB7_ARCPL|nr:unnamed protein product [Arctia plantaginis]CAB3262154.1 unnamed protein product [Arctia plantaginis]
MSQQNQNVSTPSEVVSSTEQDPNEKKWNRRGRSAKQRATSKFDRSVSDRQIQDHREAAQRRLGVFNQDAAQLEASLKSLMVTTQRRAIPVPVSTRGIGFTILLAESDSDTS